MTVGSLLTTVLAVVLVGAAVLLLLVLFVPIGFVASGHVAGLSGEARVAAWWAGGLLGVVVAPLAPLEVRIVGRTVTRVRLRESTNGTKRERAREPKGGRFRPGWRLVLRIARRAIRSLGLRAQVRGRLGTGDPADTAQLYLALTALRRLAPGIDARALTVDWVEPVADVDGMVEGRVWPLALLWIVGSEMISERRGLPRRQTRDGREQP